MNGTSLSPLMSPTECVPPNHPENSLWPGTGKSGVGCETALVLRVGLTGGIGSGKSEASKRFVALGAVLIDADQAAHDVVAAGTPGLAQVVEEFGPEVLRADGNLDRERVAGIVFNDP